MPLIDTLLEELEQEAKLTRRVLERVPNDHLAWRPHAKARTMGELALHIAVVPGAVANLALSPSPSPAPSFDTPDPANPEIDITVWSSRPRSIMRDSAVWRRTCDVTSGPMPAVHAGAIYRASWRSERAARISAMGAARPG